jgi:transposase
MKALIRRYELTDAEWERLQPYFPDRQAGDKGRPRKDSLQILNGILWIVRNGAAWRDLPERYGAWQTIYKPLCSGRKQGFLCFHSDTPFSVCSPNCTNSFFAKQINSHIA